MAQNMSQKCKVTIHQLQKFIGYLNFICKAIYSGQAFTRRMYAKILWIDKNGNKMKQHYHVPLDMEFRNDCKVWTSFLDSDNVPTALCHPFVDFSLTLHAKKLDFYMDSSANLLLGFRGYFKDQWFAGVWDRGFIKQCNLSIQYLELYAITIAIVLGSKLLINSRVQIFTDNQTAMRAVNNLSSSCKNCMYLIRIIVATQLKYNVRFFAEYVESKKNEKVDALSRRLIRKFKRLAPTAYQLPEQLPPDMYPLKKIWIN